MQLLSKVQEGYEQLWKSIIRPTRKPYPDIALGPETFQQCGIKVKRTSFQLTNSHGHVFFGSHFTPLQESTYPCIIYLHGNSSNQTEGIQYLPHLIQNNISLCTFDFTGCGNSQGQYVTLGYNQWKDLYYVVQYLRAKSQITNIGVWGRSMGAVTALRFVAREFGIVVGVYDNAFGSLKELICDLCKRNTNVPMFILSGALKIVSNTIKDKAKFDIYQLDILKNEAPLIKIPGFFIASQQDEMVPPEHSKKLFQAYKSKKKQLRLVKGNHNADRPKECIDEVIRYVKKYLFKQKKDKKKNKNMEQEVEKVEKVEKGNIGDEMKAQNGDIDETETRIKENRIVDGYDQIRSLIAQFPKSVTPKIRTEISPIDSSFKNILARDYQQYCW